MLIQVDSVPGATTSSLGTVDYLKGPLLQRWSTLFNIDQLVDPGLTKLEKVNHYLGGGGAASWIYITLNVSCSLFWTFHNSIYLWWIRIVGMIRKKEKTMFEGCWMKHSFELDQLRTIYRHLLTTIYFFPQIDTNKAKFQHLVGFFPLGSFQCSLQWLLNDFKFTGGLVEKTYPNNGCRGNEGKEGGVMVCCEVWFEKQEI